MEFFKIQTLDQGNHKVMNDMLALLDGLTIQQAESILNNLFIEIKKSRVSISNIGSFEEGDKSYNQGIGKKVLDDFNPTI